MKVSDATRSLALLACATVLICDVTIIPAGASGQRFNESKYGFSLVIPQKWVEVPLNGSDINGILTKAVKTDPTLKNALSTQIESAAKKGIKFFAIGPIGSPPGKSFFEEVDAQVKIELSQAGFVHLVTGVKTLALGKALVVTYDIPKTTSGFLASGLQIYVKHTTHVDVITITSGSLTHDRKVAKIIEKSWKWSS
jgi:hypothetical protein